MFNDIHNVSLNKLRKVSLNNMLFNNMEKLVDLQLNNTKLAYIYEERLIKYSEEKDQIGNDLENLKVKQKKLLDYQDEFVDKNELKVEEVMRNKSLGRLLVGRFIEKILVSCEEIEIIFKQK